MQLAVPNVVAIAVRMVITMLRILPQVVLLLNVPIVISLRLEVSGWGVRGERVNGEGWEGEEAMFPFLMLGVLTAHRSPLIRSLVQRYDFLLAECEL